VTRWPIGFLALLFPAAAAAAPATLPFAPGEDLRFGVRYGMVRGGDARLAVESQEMVDKEPAYRLVSTARSTRFFSTFFEVDDRVTSLWSVERQLPLVFEKKIHEGNYRKDVKVQFDHGAGVARYGDGKALEILPGAQDVLSAFYYVRSRPLVPGRSIEVPNHSDGKNYPLTVKVLRREKVQVPAGEFSCVVVEPLLNTAGLFKQEGRLTIWLTDDARKMPVLMKSKVAVGSIVAELESFRLGRPPGSGAERVAGNTSPPAHGR
jgi:hypothetical protein